MPNLKKILLSSLTLLALGSTTIQADNNGLYLGLGYSSTNIDLTIDGLNDENQEILDSSTDSILILAGYDFNEYIGLEGRYYINNSSLAYDYYLGGTLLKDAYEAESLAIYLKPQYNLDAITIYALIGMSANDYTATNILGSDSDTLFSWGGGAKFNVTQSLGLFVDYTDLGKNDGVLETGLSSWNVGFSYKF
jgi:opacity protein-like surface antigen